mgnify:FL=1
MATLGYFLPGNQPVGPTCAKALSSDHRSDARSALDYRTGLPPSPARYRQSQNVLLILIAGKYLAVSIGKGIWTCQPFSRKFLPFSSSLQVTVKLSGMNTTRKITERRLNRMIQVLKRRQPDLTVVLENVHDPHNVSAVLRSCDAVGVLAVHLVYTIEEFPDLSKNVSGSALKWLEIIKHKDIQDCYETLRSQGMTIYTTYLADPQRSHDLYSLDLTKPTALVFGNEQRGVSEEASRLADGNFVIPMMGMVQSLNISVACAVTLYEAFRQRRTAGHYDHPKLSREEISTRLHNWLQREKRSVEELQKLI